MTLYTGYGNPDSGLVWPLMGNHAWQPGRYQESLKGIIKLNNNTSYGRN